MTKTGTGKGACLSLISYTAVSLFVNDILKSFAGLESRYL